MAALTGARIRTVEQWTRIGVPHKHFDLLVSHARAKGIRGISYESLYAAKAATLRRNGAA